MGIVTESKPNGHAGANPLSESDSQTFCVRPLNILFCPDEAKIQFLFAKSKMANLYEEDFEPAITSEKTWRKDQEYNFTIDKKSGWTFDSANGELSLERTTTCNVGEKTMQKSVCISFHKDEQQLSEK